MRYNLSIGLLLNLKTERFEIDAKARNDCDAEVFLRGMVGLV